MKRLRALALLAACAALFAESSPRFTRAVNISGWFETASARHILPRRYDAQDFRDLAAIGVEAIRLPIDVHAMSSSSPERAVDPLLLDFLDMAIGWAEEAGLYIIIDNHSFDPVIPTDSDIESTLLAVWPQIASRYRDRSDLVLYEILNEPHGIDPARWARVQGNVIKAIRSVDARHWIVVGGADFNSIAQMERLPRYEDDRLVYTFHFYEPYVFTHQGTFWTKPSLKELIGIPFPSTRSAPRPPASLRGTWLEDALKTYPVKGTEASVLRALEAPIRFSRERNVPVFCGEIGVFLANTGPEDRVRWYTLVRNRLEEGGLSWALWDAYGSFGMFVPGQGVEIPEALDDGIARALGLTPSAAVKERRADGTKAAGSLVIYDDYPARGMKYTGYATNGEIDLYAPEGKAHSHAIRMRDLDRYNYLGLAFAKSVDLSDFSREGALMLSARTNGVPVRVDVRLVSPGEMPEDIPWRMSYTLDLPAGTTADGWRSVTIPLSAMTVTGAWKDQWIEPKGDAFDWTRVRSIEIAAEHGALRGVDLIVDDIAVVRSSAGR